MLHAQLVDVEDSMRSVTAGVSELAARMTAEAVEKVESDLQAARRRIGTVEDEKRAVEDRAVQLQRKVADLEIALRHSEKVRAELQGEQGETVQSLHGRVQEEAFARESAERKTAISSEQAKRLQQKVNLLETARSALEKNYATVQVERDHMKDEVADLRREVAAAKARSESLRASSPRGSVSKANSHSQTVALMNKFKDELALAKADLMKRTRLNSSHQWKSRMPSSA